MTPPFTPEQILLLADKFCEAHQVRIRDYSALVAAAVVPGARIDGIPIHAHPTAAGEALAQAIDRLEPLSGLNREFGDLCRGVYHRFAP